MVSAVVCSKAKVTWSAAQSPGEASARTRVQKPRSDSGITGGFSDGTFKPAAAVTRSSMAAFLYRFAGEPPFVPPVTPSFSDVPTNHAFFLEVEWLADSGVTGGFSNGTFKPGQAVSRQSMAAFLHKEQKVLAVRMRG